MPAIIEKGNSLVQRDVAGPPPRAPILDSQPAFERKPPQRRTCQRCKAELIGREGMVESIVQRREIADADGEPFLVQCAEDKRPQKVCE